MLKFEFWYIFETVANVLILFVLLRIFLFKPLNKIINERTQSIQNDIDSAKKAKSEAEELKEQYESTIGDAKEEAKNIIMKAHEDAESERDAIIKKAHEDAEQKVAEADKEIESERKKVLRQAQSEIADLAIEAASKIVGANVDDEKNRRLVDEFLSGKEGGSK
jgi:F-type H+-transporting ATPase subunit b